MCYSGKEWSDDRVRAPLSFNQDKSEFTDSTSYINGRKISRIFGELSPYRPCLTPSHASFFEELTHP